MGSRSLREQLNREGIPIIQDRVRQLMRRMGINALYRRPRTAVPAHGHRIYPYLLGGLSIERPNQGRGGGRDHYPDGPGLPVLGGNHRLVRIKGFRSSNWSSTTSPSAMESKLPIRLQTGSPLEGCAPDLTLTRAKQTPGVSRDSRRCRKPGGGYLLPAQ